MEDEIWGECAAIDSTGFTDCEIKSPWTGVLDGSQGSYGKRSTTT